MLPDESRPEDALTPPSLAFGPVNEQELASGLAGSDYVCSLRGDYLHTIEEDEDDWQGYLDELTRDDDEDLESGGRSRSRVAV